MKRHIIERADFTPLNHQSDARGASLFYSDGTVKQTVVSPGQVETVYSFSDGRQVRFSKWDMEGLHGLRSICWIEHLERGEELPAFGERVGSNRSFDRVHTGVQARWADTAFVMIPRDMVCLSDWGLLGKCGKPGRYIIEEKVNGQRIMEKLYFTEGRFRMSFGVSLPPRPKERTSLSSINSGLSQ